MKVSIFMPCIIDQLFPETGKNLCFLMDRFQIKYDFNPSVTCCGQLLYKTGYTRKAKELAKKLMLAFIDSRYVVSPSLSCVNMLRNHYKRLFSPKERWYYNAKELSTKVYEFSEFLVYIVGMEAIKGVLHGKAVLHNSCQLKYQDKGTSPSRLILDRIQGLEIVDIPGGDKCCGFGGIFSFMFPHISHAILKEKADEIINSGAQIVVGAEMSCLMNISGYLKKRGSPIRTIHIVDLLSEAIR